MIPVSKAFAVNEFGYMGQLPSHSDDQESRWAVLGGFLAAVLASSCCLGPLLLVTLGVGGAWIGNLKMLEAWQPLFITLAVVFLAFGFWRFYFKSRRVCLDDSSCDTPVSQRLMKSILWISAALIVAAATTEAWAPYFY